PFRASSPGRRAGAASRVTIRLGRVDVIRMLGVGEAPLSVADVYWSVCDVPSAGIALFAGVVRDEDEGRAVTGLGYSAHTSVEVCLRGVVEKAIGRYPIQAVSAVHRVGDLKIGDIAVIVAVACPRRGEAFDACRQIIDQIKDTVPLWEHQRFADRSAERGRAGS